MPSSDIAVRPVTSGRDLKRFIDFTYSHYEGNPFFVPPLRMDLTKVLNEKKNPFFEHGAIGSFIAEDASGKMVGRISAIRNGMHLKKYDDGVGFFGFFETTDDDAVADALFEAASGWLQEHGLTAVRGPANPSLNDIAGLLVDGFNSEPS
ncbi:MAG: hypothetical protein R3284_12285, partial [Rubricoccaceae bacterium]|nr:hypothetical protein [Rubricoccaceae bacterium]